MNRLLNNTSEIIKWNSTDKSMAQIYRIRAQALRLKAKTIRIPAEVSWSDEDEKDLKKMQEEYNKLDKEMDEIIKEGKTDTDDFEEKKVNSNELKSKINELEAKKKSYEDLQKEITKEKESLIKEANDYLKPAEVMDEKGPETIFVKAKILYDQGKNDQAMKLFDKIRRNTLIKKDPKIVLELARYYAKEGKSEASEAKDKKRDEKQSFLESIKEGYKSFLGVVLPFWGEVKKLRKSQIAYNMYLNAIDLNRNNFDLRLEFAEFAWENGNEAQAIAQIEYVGKYGNDEQAAKALTLRADFSKQCEKPIEVNVDNQDVKVGVLRRGFNGAMRVTKKFIGVPFTIASKLPIFGIPFIGIAKYLNGYRTLDKNKALTLYNKVAINQNADKE
ncbi:hypothetical protein BVX93_00110, partial [bacterium B13(2017)]